MRKSGKALYAGISNYNPEQTRRAVACMKEMGMHMLIHQPNYSMFNRSIENGLTAVCAEEGVGIMAFGPLAGGRLTGRLGPSIPQVLLPRRFHSMGFPSLWAPGTLTVIWARDDRLEGP